MANPFGYGIAPQPGSRKPRPFGDVGTMRNRTTGPPPPGMRATSDALGRIAHVPSSGPGLQRNLQHLASGNATEGQIAQAGMAGGLFDRIGEQARSQQGQHVEGMTQAPGIQPISQPTPLAQRGLNPAQAASTQSAYDRRMAIQHNQSGTQRWNDARRQNVAARGGGWANYSQPETNPGVLSQDRGTQGPLTRIGQGGGVPSPTGYSAAGSPGAADVGTMMGGQPKVGPQPPPLPQGRPVSSPSPSPTGGMPPQPPPLGGGTPTPQPPAPPTATPLQGGTPDFTQAYPDYYAQQQQQEAPAGANAERPRDYTRTVGQQQPAFGAPGFAPGGPSDPALGGTGYQGGFRPQPQSRTSQPMTLQQTPPTPPPQVNTPQTIQRPTRQPQAMQLAGGGGGDLENVSRTVTNPAVGQPRSVNWGGQGQVGVRSDGRGGTGMTPVMGRLPNPIHGMQVNPEFSQHAMQYTDPNAPNFGGRRAPPPERPGGGVRPATSSSPPTGSYQPSGVTRPEDWQPATRQNMERNWNTVQPTVSLDRFGKEGRTYRPQGPGDTLFDSLSMNMMDPRQRQQQLQSQFSRNQSGDSLRGTVHQADPRFNTLSPGGRSPMEQGAFMGYDRNQNMDRFYGEHNRQQIAQRGNTFGPGGPLPPGQQVPIHGGSGGQRQLPNGMTVSGMQVPGGNQQGFTQRVGPNSVRSYI